METLLYYIFVVLYHTIYIELVSSQSNILIAFSSNSSSDKFLVTIQEYLLWTMATSHVQFFANEGVLLSLPIPKL